MQQETPCTLMTQLLIVVKILGTSLIFFVRTFIQSLQLMLISEFTPAQKYLECTFKPIAYI